MPSHKDRKPDTTLIPYPTFGVYSSPHETLCGWPSMDFFIEWRPNEHSDGFRETFTDKQLLDRRSDRALKARSKMFTYAAHLMDSQYRTCVFAVDIYGDHARLYRFDTSCTVVSEPIRFRKEPKLLEEFFSRYCAASLTYRGHDPTVIAATDAERTLFQARVKEYYARAKEKNLRTHPGVRKLTSEIVKIQVNDQDGVPHWYLARKCSSMAAGRAPYGRFTRGFVATPVSPSIRCGKDHDTPHSQYQKGVLYWLKDSWRPSSGESEISIYSKLKERGVPNLPNIVCAGDIIVDGVVQGTTNDTLFSDPGVDSWVRPTMPVRPMIHHRIVSGLLIPLQYAENAKDLLLVGRDVLNGDFSSISYHSFHTIDVCSLAIAGAFHRGGVYHCDISAGNVMMTERRGDDGEGPWGVLNDWDHALWIDAPPTDRVVSLHLDLQCRYLIFFF